VPGEDDNVVPPSKEVATYQSSNQFLSELVDYTMSLYLMVEILAILVGLCVFLAVVAVALYIVVSYG
jgi:hypothetical protein